MTSIILNKKISSKNSYSLKEGKKGGKFPIVSDVMFHVMFNNESRIKYISYLISLVLDISYKEILNKIHFVKNNLDRKNYYNPSKTVDLLCEIDGKYYNIEVNNNGTKDSLERNISYASDIYKSKMRKRDKYQYVHTIQININNFSFEGVDEVVQKFMLRDNKGDILTEKLTFYYIFLPKIKEKYYTKGIKNLSSMEKMFLVLNEDKEDILKELSKGDDVMEEYIKDAVDASGEEEIIGLYDRELHLEMLKNAEIDEAKEEAIKEGIKEGIEEGRKEGIKEGREEGRKDAILTIAKNMLEKNVPIDTIMDYTNLSKEQIENLK